MLLDILLAILILVCLSLIGVILLQRSEGGALGMSGGGPGAFMTARGTGDLLTRTTQTLGGVFFGLCLVMTLVSGHSHGATSLVDSMKLNALGATSSTKPLSSAPGLPAGPATNPALPLGPAPFAAPQQPQGGSLNLLGAPQAPLAAPVAHTATPAPAKPGVTLNPAAPAKPRPAQAKAAKTAAPTAAPTPSSAAPPAAAAPVVTPAPLTVPPPPAPAPAASGAAPATSGQ